MSTAKYPRILCFINGPLASEAETAAKMALGPNAVFRNANVVSDDERPEACDGVTGAIPKAYAHLPRGDKVIADFYAALNVPAAPVVGTPAPVAPVIATPANPAAPPAPPAPLAPAGWPAPPAAPANS